MINVWCYSHKCLNQIFFLYRKRQLEYDLVEDEVNQYCFSTEILDTIDRNHAECKERRHMEHR